MRVRASVRARACAYVYVVYRPTLWRVLHGNVINLNYGTCKSAVSGFPTKIIFKLMLALLSGYIPHILLSGTVQRNEQPLCVQINLFSRLTINSAYQNEWPA